MQEKEYVLDGSWFKANLFWLSLHCLIQGQKWLVFHILKLCLVSSVSFAFISYIKCSFPFVFSDHADSFRVVLNCSPGGFLFIFLTSFCFASPGADKIQYNRYFVGLPSFIRNFYCYDFHLQMVFNFCGKKIIFFNIITSTPLDVIVSASVRPASFTGPGLNNLNLMIQKQKNKREKNVDLW